MDELDMEWDNFINNNTNYEHYDDKNKDILNITDIAPKCSEIYISTKTKISYLTSSIDLKDIFWKINVISYGNMREGVVKKQMKFNSGSKEDVEKIDKLLSEYEYGNSQIIQKIDNPEGRIKFRDIRKINIGICKKDMLTYRSKAKSAFYNCFVLILRIMENEKYKEYHVKVFNTGKLEIPGIQQNESLYKILDLLIVILRGIGLRDINYLKNKEETVLINSNFNTNYYINRDKLFDILKSKYKLQCVYDPCSYPGIQCTIFFNDIEGVKTEKIRFKNECKSMSFMIFRTGSVLIVGKCNDNNLYDIYDLLKIIFKNEYIDIKDEGEFIKKDISKKKVKKRVILIS